MKTAKTLGPRVVAAMTAAVVATNISLVEPATAQETTVEARVQNALARAGVDPVWTRVPGVTVVSDTDISVSLDAPAASLSAEGSALDIALIHIPPATIESSSLGQLYGGVLRDTDAVVQTTEAGVRFLSVMHSPAAPTVQQYVLDLPNGATLTEVEGGYVLNDATGATIGAIEAPWARDATGRLLPTEYELQGSILTQHTDTTGAVYPIVVDPKVTIGLGVYLNMWGTEVKAYATAIVAVFGTGIAISCTLISKLPHQILRTLATLICGAAAISLRSVFDAIVEFWRTTAIVSNWCYQMRIFPHPPTDLTHVSSGNCV